MVKNRFFIIASALGLALSLSMISGCKGGLVEVKECKDYDADESACNNAKTTAGVKCYYDNSKCVEVPKHQDAQGLCAELSAHQDKCESRMDCKYNNKKCEDAVPASCDNVKNDKSCNTVYGAMCAWNDTASPKKCEAKGKKYTAYDLNMLPFIPAAGQLAEAGALALSPAHVRGVAGSLDHTRIYVIALINGVAAKIAASTDNGATWAAVTNLNDRGQPSDNLNPVDLSGGAAAITLWAPTQDGLMIGKGGVGFARIVGGAVAANNGWTNAVANLNSAGAAANSFFEAKRGVNRFVYITASAVGGVGSVVFTAVPPPAAVAWDSLVGHDVLDNGGGVGGGGNLTQRYTAIGQLPDSRLVMGNTRGIFTVPAAGVGADHAQQEQAENAPVLATIGAGALLRLNPAAAPDNDQGIAAITLVDGKYLLLGFNANANDNGGFIAVDVSDANAANWTFQRYGLGLRMSVNKIVASSDNKAAMITSDRGAVYFKDGQIVEMAPGVTLINIANVADAANRADAATSKSGFSGSLPVSAFVGSAQDANGRWYLGTSGAGVMTLDIKDIQL